MASADATGCKEEGNGAMARGDFVNAMKWYSQALALNPKEAALYSNRSFAFLRLGLTARALSDADEAARRRPDWAKGHFRRAEALSQAGLHDEALRAYEMGCRCDPADEHLSAQCIEAKARQAAQRQAELTRVVAAGVLGLLVLGLLLLAPGSEAAAPKPGARAPSGALRALQAGVGLLLGAAVGAGAGAGTVLLQRHSRKGATLPPLESNERFAALQMRGDAAEAGGAAGPLRSRVLEAEPERPAAAGTAAAAAAAAAPKGKPDGAKPAKARSTQNGRAAALKAMGKTK